MFDKCFLNGSRNDHCGGAVKSEEILNGLALEVNNKSLLMGKTVAAIAQIHARAWHVS
jgi:hypothetical protein